MSSLWSRFICWIPHPKLLRICLRALDSRQIEGNAEGGRKATGSVWLNLVSDHMNTSLCALSTASTLLIGPVSQPSCQLLLLSKCVLSDLFSLAEISRFSFLYNITLSLEMLTWFIQSPPNILEQQGQFLCFCYTLKTIDFEVKRCTWDDRSEFQLLFPGIFNLYL